MSGGEIKRGMLAAYAAPNFALAIMHMPVAYVIPALYAKHTTVSLAAIGAILLAGRLFDAVTDPLIGFCSDRFNTRFGRRRPWMIAGVPFAAVSVIFLFSPPSDAGVLYFLLASMGLFAAWTIIEIPYAAWGAELSRDYNERSRIMTWRMVFGQMGLLLFLTSPILLQPITGTTELGPEVMNIAAYVAAIGLPVLTLLMVFRVPEPAADANEKLDLRALGSALLTNRPLHIFLLATLLSGIGVGAWVATAILFISDHLGIADKFVYLLIVAWSVRIAVAPLWLRIMYRFGKHKTWAFAQGMAAFIVPLSLLVSPGESAFFIMLGYSVLLGVFETVGTVAPYAILGDIADYDAAKTGANKTSSFYALLGLVQKAVGGLGGGIAFFTLSLFSYNVDGGNSGAEKIGLFVAFAFIPTVLYLICAMVIYRFPLNARRQETIRKQLERRARRKSQNA